jgi:hypothetical protein
MAKNGKRVTGRNPGDDAGRPLRDQGSEGPTPFLDYVRAAAQGDSPVQQAATSFAQKLGAGSSTLGSPKAGAVQGASARTTQSSQGFAEAVGEAETSATGYPGDNRVDYPAKSPTQPRVADRSDVPSDAILNSKNTRERSLQDLLGGGAGKPQSKTPKQARGRGDTSRPGGR